MYVYMYVYMYVCTSSRHLACLPHSLELRRRLAHQRTRLLQHPVGLSSLFLGAQLSQLALGWYG